MVALHQKLALVIVLLALAGVLWAGSRASRGVVSSRLPWLAGLTVAAIAMQAVAGTVIVATGGRPADASHFVFGPATLLALPLALVIARERQPRAASYIVLAAWLATFVLSLRDLGTGGIGA